MKEHRNIDRRELLKTSGVGFATGLTGFTGIASASESQKTENPTDVTRFPEFSIYNNSKGEKTVTISIEEDGTSIDAKSYQLRGFNENDVTVQSATIHKGPFPIVREGSQVVSASISSGDSDQVDIRLTDSGLPNRRQISVYIDPDDSVWIARKIYD